MQMAVLTINGMSCKHCVNTIETTLRELNGVTQASVDLAAGRAFVTYKPEQVTVEQLVAAVSDAGYPAKKA